MNGKNMMDGLNFIDRQLVEEAETERLARRPARRTWGVAAACAAVVLTAALALPWVNFGAQSLEQPDRNEDWNTPIGQPYDELLHGGAAGETVGKPEGGGLVTNPVDEPSLDTTMEICLAREDFCAMTWEELLAYFGCGEDLLQTALPDMTAQPLSGEEFGIFRRAEGEVYYDVNVICLSDGSGEKEIRLTLSKVRRPAGVIMDLSGEELKFQSVNGRSLALFSWVNADGDSCTYVEFTQHDTAHAVLFQNLTDGEVIACLNGLVEEDASERQNGTAQDEYEPYYPGNG